MKCGIFKSGFLIAPVLGSVMLESPPASVAVSGDCKFSLEFSPVLVASRRLLVLSSLPFGGSLGDSTMTTPDAGSAASDGLSADDTTKIASLSAYYNQFTDPIQIDLLSELRIALAAQLENIHALDQKHGQLLSTSVTTMLLLASAAFVSLLKYDWQSIGASLGLMATVMLVAAVLFAVSIRPGRPTGLPGSIIPDIAQMPSLPGCSDRARVRTYSMALTELKISKNYQAYSRRVRAAKYATFAMLLSPLIGLVCLVTMFVVDSSASGHAREKDQQTESGQGAEQVAADSAKGDADAE